MKDKLVAGGVFVALIVGVLALMKGPSVVQGPPGADGKPIEVVAGALSSPDIQSPYLSFGNVRAWGSGSDFRTGTSTLCAIQSPAATSTLVSATLRMDSLPYELTDVVIARGTTAFATSTILAFKDVFTTSELGYLVATTTLTTLVDGIVLPNSFINFRYSTTTVVNANFQPTGKCSVVFREI